MKPEKGIYYMGQSENFDGKASTKDPAKVYGSGLIKILRETPANSLMCARARQVEEVVQPENERCCNSVRKS